MSLVDFEVFLRERLSAYDDKLDLSSGAPLDTRVIQPILRRLGTDPFSVDMATFIIERLAQEFPDLATTDGDGVSDLLVKPALVLWDPIIREVQRVKNMQSFRDPSILTTDEAEALGANLFAERDTGDFARGTARIYFAQPQPQTITPGNFITSRAGLHYFPTTTQSIRSEEMLLNKEGDSYYFDIGVIAEAVGTDYNIDTGELVTIANVASAVRVTNKQRFRFGQVEQDATAFVGEIQQSLTERSLVTLRGIASQVGQSFSDITRMAVVGFNDPEMQRDVLTGGGLGAMVASGFDAQVVADGENKPLSRRFSDSTADFFTSVGPAGDVEGFVITLFDVFGGTTANKVRDLDVVRVINSTTLEVAEQVLYPGTYVGELANKVWSLRQRSITLSNIPGGIVFPDGPNGTVEVPPGVLHIGGMTDIHVRGSDLDTASFTLDLASDDSPVLQGVALDVIPGAGPPAFQVQLDPLTLVLGTDFQIGDATHLALSNAKTFQYTLQILEGAAAGAYRVLDVIGLNTNGAAPILWLDPEPPNVSGSFRWRLLDELDIDLVEPKETRVAGVDGLTTQNLNVFTTAGGVDFDELGVSSGDILRLKNGTNKADYVVVAVTSPFFTQLEIDRPFIASSAGVSYEVFRGNTGGGVDRPLVRITSIDILDTTGQPIGTKIPYAKPVDALSSQFANAGTGIKASAVDVTLGIISQAEPGGGFVFGGGGNFAVTWDGLVSPVSLTLSGTLSAAAVIAAINVASQAAVGVDLAVELQYNGDTFVGLIPIGPNTRTSVAVGTASGVLLALFGGSDNTRVFSSADVRSLTLTTSGWPVLDAELDVLWVVDGLQSGFYSEPVVVTSVSVEYKLTVAYDFAPELARAAKVGSRSLGNARIYFLEPTSAEIDQDTVFTYTTVDGVPVHFKPDPTLGHTLIPALPNGTKPEDGVSSPGTTFLSASTDFVSKGVRPGDELVLDYIPVVGSATLADPVPGLALTDIIISLNDQANKKITFINDVGVAGAVSRSGIAEQINSAVGLTICSIVEVSPGDNRLRFDPTTALNIRWQNGTANTLLGFNTSGDTNNNSDYAGTYSITAVYVGSLTVSPAFGSFGTISDQQFQVTRPGAQRITTSTMAAQVAEASLYYWDVELVSEGTGDLWNIAADSQLTLSGYRSDGYYLTTDNETTAFSAAESLKLHISRSILAQGVDDAPENAIQVSGQSLSIAYERSQLVESLQNFITSDVERVICSNPLSRYLSPHFVRFDASYAGGYKPVDVLPDIQQQIKDLRPDEALSSSALQKTLSDRGATSITNPIELVAVVYNFDRSVTVTRSKDELTTGRLAAFIPDTINLTRRTK